MSSTGTPVVPGVGVGVVITPAPRPTVPADEPVATDPAATTAAFEQAAERVAGQLAGRASLATGSAAEVLSATASLARDRGLAALVAKHAPAAGPASATTAAVDELITMFTAAGGLMAERVTDLRDVRDRVVADLLGLPEPGIVPPTEPSVLFADDLAPADTAGLDPALVVAIAVRLGGTTSHTAIIARQLGIPCVVGVTDLPLDDLPTRAMVDGTTGEVVPDPDPSDAERRVELDRTRREASASWTGPGRTADGRAVQVLANVQDAAGAARAATEPIEGFGLYRTELSFLDRAAEPTVTEQTEIYSDVMRTAQGDKVVIRTLDAGSDKPLAFADMGTEPNPALGVRGLRIATSRPDLLTHQLDAIAAAAQESGADVWVMAPMVSVPSEARDFAALVRERGLTAGVMIETPSAALLADRLLDHVDFVSIGTNDLSQYAFAADRMAAELGHLTDPWQLGLLRLIEIVADAGRAAGKPVGVCGEAAADPQLACVLVGLGVTSLSCAATAVRAVGAQLAGATAAQCEEAARAALAADDPTEARAVVAEVLGA